MINHHIQTALAHERASTLLADAQAVRRARQARPVRPRADSSAGVVALDRAGEYSLDWWFRCVDDGRVFSSR